MVLAYHPNAQQETGTIGLLLVVSGMAGSIACGYILDKFHHYKLVNIHINIIDLLNNFRMTTLTVYLFSFLGMILFTFTLGWIDIWIVFVIACVLG